MICVLFNRYLVYQCTAVKLFCLKLNITTKQQRYRTYMTLLQTTKINNTITHMTLAIKYKLCILQWPISLKLL